MGPTTERREVQQLREPTIVNPDPKYNRVRLIEPTTRGYIHIAAEMQPRRVSFMRKGREKSELLARLKDLAQQLEHIDAVEQVTVFDAVVMPPLRRLPYIRERGDAVRLARFDIVVLIETKSPVAARDLQTTPAYRALLDTLAIKAKRTHVIAARNTKRIGDVDTSRDGVFLFNYFVGDDPEIVLKLWDYLAGWYTVETGLNNSALFVPLEGERSDYVAINSARWDGSPLGVFRQQVTKKSFRSYVLANLEANHVGAMPVLYRLAPRPSQPSNRARLLVLAAGAVAVGTGLALWASRRAAQR